MNHKKSNFVKYFSQQQSNCSQADKKALWVVGYIYIYILLHKNQSNNINKSYTLQKKKIV